MLNRDYTVINGNNVDVTTVFDTTVEYKPTIQEGIDIVDEATELLQKYFDYMDDDTGLWKMFGADGSFWKAKGWIISAMKKHPDYNGRYQIVLHGQDMHRYLNPNAINDFWSYVIRYIDRNAEYADPITGEIISEKEKYDRFNAWDCKCYDYGRMFRSTHFEIYRKASDRAFKIKDKYCYLQKLPNWSFVNDAVRYLCGEMVRIADSIEDADEMLNKHFITEDMAKELERIATENGITLKGVRPGHKVSKVMLKICRLINITSHSDIRDVSFYRQDGEYVQRTRDEGWNWQYAQFSDGVNPSVVKGTAVISVNPIDFWTMSFGYRWASCHTIDKENRRCNEHNYSGCYCGGTQSYMGDKASIIFYFLPDNFNGDHPELEDKVKRCVFYLGEDKLIQSRVYPDGRDGGDKTLAGDIRAIMQKVVAELWDVPNYWSLSKGRRACREVTRSFGPHYRDYEQYDDCNVSYLKRIDGYKNTNPVDIGTSEIICPSCGKSHYSEENIFCGKCCGFAYECEECGRTYSEEDMYEINGRWYCYNCTTWCYHCDDRIVINHSTTTAEDRCVCNWCRDRYYVWSEYDCEYVDSDEAIVTEEGNTYVSGSNGYGWCSNCETYHDSDAMNYDIETHSDYCDECYAKLLASRESEQLDYVVGE